MTNDKFKMLEGSEVNGRVLPRVQALRDFNDVKQGDIGGFVESESMLDSNDNSWVYGDSMVTGEGSFITGDSEVYDNAKVHSSVLANSTVRSYSEVTNSELQDSYVHKASQVHDSNLNDSYLSHDTQVRDSNLTQASLETAYIQDVTAGGLDDGHVVHIGDDVTRVEMVDSVELSRYNEKNINEYVDKYKVDAVELSDDDLSDLNEASKTTSLEQ